MSPQNGKHAPASLVDAYLDGLLDTLAREAFEQRLAADADVSAVLERQRTIDAGLRRRFQPPDVERVLAGVLAAPKKDARSVIKLPWWMRATRMAVAAVLLVGVSLAGAWFALEYLDSRSQTPLGPPPKTTFAAVYEKNQQEGFKGWSCEGRDFAMSFYNRFGQGLLMIDLPKGSTCLGLDYCHTITPYTTYLVASVQGSQVLVFVDELKKDAAPPAGDAAGLKVHRRVINGLVLYEVSPRDAPQLLDLLFEPACIPDAWLGSGGYGGRVP